MRVGLFYATNTGYTEAVAHEICARMGPLWIETCRNIEGMSLKDLDAYDVLILGVATWDAGDLPYDWAILYEDMDQFDFSQTKIVMFGLGDQRGYPGTFLDAMGLLYQKLINQGAQGGYGFWPIDGYRFEGSMACRGRQFCGLAIDEENQVGLTSKRIAQWSQQIKRELGFLRLCHGATDNSERPQATG